MSDRSALNEQGPEPPRVWTEKYRPETLDDVVAHGDIVRAIKALAAPGAPLPHLLLAGPPGTGKTSTALALAKQLHGGAARRMTLELNASVERGIAVVRSQIREFVQTGPYCWGSAADEAAPKLVVLDECDAMTHEAQSALRCIIEKHHRNARFVLICNDEMKVVEALRSRCTRFRFSPLQRADVALRVREICAAEGVALDDAGVAAVVRRGRGDMRATINALQTGGPPSAGPATECGDGFTQLRAALWGGGGAGSFALPRAYAALCDAMRDRDLADVLQGLEPWLFELDMPTAARADLVAELADIEYNLSLGTNPRLQAAGAAAAFAFAAQAAAGLTDGLAHSLARMDVQ